MAPLEMEAIMESEYDFKRYCGVGFRFGGLEFDDNQKVIGYKLLLNPSPFATPATRAGMKDGDTIIAVDSYNNDTWEPTDSHQEHYLFRGPADSKVGVRYISQETQSIKEIVLVRDYIVEYLDPGPIPQLSIESKDTIPLEKNSGCEFMSSEADTPDHGLGSFKAANTLTHRERV